ncbi:MAG: translocation/assembly module TamB domain-containing protein, partial [Sediminibacterium sp.]
VILLVFIAIQTDLVQNWLVGKVTSRLSKSLGAEVSVKNVSFSFFNKLNMDGVLVRDRKKDTILYAGQVRVRITDWFFLKDKAVLKYVGLENAVINLERKDSVWNYGFIVDYFSSPTPSKKKGNTIELNLKKVDLKNVRFVKNDFWAGERLDVFTGSLSLDAETVDFKKNEFVLNSLELDKPFLRIQGLKPLRPDSLYHRANKVDTGMYFNQGNIGLYLTNLVIHNGNLFLDSDTDKPGSGFDGSHIQLSKLNAVLQNISFHGDTLRANIDLSAKDRSGLELKKLKTKFKLTPQIMELAKLDLQTNRSRISDYYAMQFKDFNKDFGHYISNVVMNAHFTNAKINSDDIAFFAPELKTWKREVILSGKFLGTVDDFTVNNLAAKIGATTKINGNLKMKGLSDIDKTKIDLTNGTLLTNYYDLGTFIPSLKGVTSPNLAALGNIIYRGNFNGTIHDFVTAGTFSTQLGGVKTNVSLQLPRKGEPVYTGAIETSRFNIGKFLNDSSFGLVDFKGKIVGTSFNVENLKTTLEGTVSSLEYNKYTYTNIVTLGTFQKKYFTGEVKIDDPNLDFTSTVEIDLSQDLPRFNILGDLVHTNLRALNLIKDSVELTGLLDLNFTGTTIDNFLGTAKFLNAKIKKGSTSISFDSLNLSSAYVDSIKSFHLGSNDLSATILGKFSILDLPASFQAFLTHYYPTYINQPKTTPENQVFSFTLNTGNIEPYLQLLDKKLYGFNDASIKGSVDTRNNQLALTASIPTGSYGNLNFTGVDLQAKGTRDTLSLAGNINSIQVSDSMRFPNTKLNVKSYNDHSEVAIKTSADNTLNDADLFADVYTLPDGVRIQFRPSSFVLNEKKWAIEKSGELTFRTDLVQAQNVKFTQGFQEISVETAPPVNGEKTNNLAVKLKNVVLGDLASLFFKNPRLQGITTGTVVLNDVTGKSFHANADLKAEQFRLDDDSIGLVNIKAQYDKVTGEIPFSIESPNDGYHFTANGKYSTKDTTGKSFTTDIQLANSKIDILHKFLSNIFSNISGQATGDLKISGDLNAPDLLGKIKLRKAGMKVNYSQVYYTIDSADINFKEDGIDFGRFNIQDRYKNTGTVSGKLTERGFKNMVFDFELSTNKLLLIDTKVMDNQQFYGKAIGRADLKLKGPESDARMTIIAESNDTSHIYIPNSINRENGVADFIVFKQYGTEMVQQSAGNNFNLTVDLDITATNDVTIDVILDADAGEAIRAVGNGKLKIKAGTKEPLNIRGRYNIDKGNYVFNFQNFIHRPFELLPGAGNYIEWTGDAFKADLHIDAQYTAERISVSELVGNLGMNEAVKGYRGDVYIIAQLRDKLNHPSITFKLDFPLGSPVKYDNEFQQYITRLEKDQDEILRQVAFLILFNSFSPQTGTGTGSSNSPYSITSLGVNSLSQLLTKGINKVVSNILFKLTGDQSLRFDVGTSIYSSASLLNPSGGSIDAGGAANKLDRTRVDLKLSRAFANDKIIVTLGSDIDFNIGNSAIQNGNSQWLPNFTIEFVLTKDKKLRLIVFNKASLDLTGTSFGRRNRQGISISYRKDFEKLFGNKEKDIEFKAPADSTAKP